ncbi:MAG: hypothetical protein K6E91_07880 [Butyrivibrio sp.]|nr:hypothetical protein [Butyrivibrio sp.]
MSMMKKNSGKEKKFHSLAKRMTFTAIIFVLVIALAGIIGVVRAVFNFMKIGEAYDAFTTAQTVVHLSANLTEMSDSDREGLTEQVMTVYRGLSDEERSRAGTEEYRSRFDSVTQSEYYKKL